MTPAPTSPTSPGSASPAAAPATEPSMSAMPLVSRPAVGVASAEQSGTSFIDAIKAGKPVTSAMHPSLLKAEHVIKVEDFQLWYGDNKALHGVTMGFPRSKVTAMIGPSGCGKSTLLRSINRLNDLIEGVRVAGTLALSGDDVYAPKMDVINLRKRLGMVFQKSNPFPMSIFENVVYGLRIDGEKRKGVLADACESALRAAALWEEVKDRLKGSALGLSGGQQQRLCIARAIAAEPEVLLMDEPCSALDPIATLKIEEFIRSIAGRITVVIVTHNMQQAARVSDNTAFFYLGRLVEYGPTADIFQNPMLPETESYVTGRFG